MKYCVASILPHSLKGEDGGGRPSRHERQSSFQGVARNDDDSDGDGNGVGERSIAPSGSDRYPHHRRCCCRRWRDFARPPGRKQNVTARLGRYSQRVSRDERKGRRFIASAALRRCLAACTPGASSSPRQLARPFRARAIPIRARPLWPSPLY